MAQLASLQVRARPRLHLNPLIAERLDPPHDKEPALHRVRGLRVNDVVEAALLSVVQPAAVEAARAAEARWNRALIRVAAYETRIAGCNLSFALLHRDGALCSEVAGRTHPGAGQLR
jgi:hypothetical protein